MKNVNTCAANQQKKIKQLHEMIEIQYTTTMPSFVISEFRRGPEEDVARGVVAAEDVSALATACRATFNAQFGVSELLNSWLTNIGGSV